MIDSVFILSKQRILSAPRVRAALALALISAISSGCSEYRTSLAEFLALERELNAQPAPPSPEEASAIDELMDRQLGAYVVGPSDVLLVTFTGVSDAALLAPLSVRVDRQGSIDLPLVGDIEVSGLELEDVDDRIKGAYVPAVFRDAAVHTDVVSSKLTNVVVRGAVSIPGMVPLRRTERNLLYAVIGAGGVSDLASGKVTLSRMRRSLETVTLDLTNARDLHAAMALDPLENGDVVTVEAAMPNTIFVGGLVNLPRSQSYAAGVKMSVLQALAAAGGLRTDVIPTEGTLIRRMSNGEDAHVKLDLNRIVSGRDPNIFLEPGDILWVPHTASTRVQEWINQNLFFKAGVTYTVTGIEFLNRSRQQSAAFGSSSLEDSFDPFGFLGRDAALNRLGSAPPVGP